MDKNKIVKTKYPKTPHLSWSMSLTNDDKMIEDISVFYNQPVVVTEKIDGENTSFYKDYCHARSLEEESLSAKQRWSREWVKNLWGNIRYEIPENMRICGENVFAKHSISYYNLPTYFFVFAIMQDDIVLSWSEIEEWCDLLNLTTVPVLYSGIWNETEIKKSWPILSDHCEQTEGYVIRNAQPFSIKDVRQNIAKFVRPKHVQTDQSWIYGEWVANKLKEK